MHATGHIVRLVLASLALTVPCETYAERLPIRTYTSDDGLAHNIVNKIVRDSRGFLWFATNEGLSRFDGYGFSNFGLEHGLPHGRVTDLLETRSGELWVATFGGLVRFRPDGTPLAKVVNENDAAGPAPMFTVVVPGDPEPRARIVTVLLEGGDGTIWVGTRKGIFRLDRSGGRIELKAVDVGMPFDHWESGFVSDLLEDRHGNLWVAAVTGLYRRWADGAAARYTVRDGLPNDYLHDLLEDRQGRLWVASRYNGFFRLAVDAGRSAPTIAEAYGVNPPLPTGWISALRISSDGRFWVATPIGLLEFHPDAQGSTSFRGYARRNGLVHNYIRALGEDVDGNLWMGTEAGAMKLARHGFTTYGEEDNIHSVHDVFEDATGAMYVRGTVLDASRSRYSNVTAERIGTENYYVSFGRFDDGRITWFTLRPPFSYGWVPERTTMRAHDGEWWIAGDALFRFPAIRSFMELKDARARRTYTPKDGLAAQQVLRMFEDSRGDIWLSTMGQSYGLARWERENGTLRDLAGAPGLPPVADEVARSLGEDASGNVWLGFQSGVARYRDGKFAFFSERDGMPAANVAAISSDSRGRLWLATERGVVRVDGRDDERPAFKVFTTAEGFSGSRIDAITEDLDGRMYFATRSGIDQFNPATGGVRTFTTDDGVALGTISTAFRDREGTLWFASSKGLSRFTPPPPMTTSDPPAVLIDGLTVAGSAYPVSAIGSREVALPDLAHDGNQIDVTFLALGFAAGERLRYQYRLEGSAGDWSPLTTRRSVTYANLSPGTYRFVVRAVNADGAVSPDPAVVSFVILLPFWQRWWFLSLVALSIALLALALHRVRLSRALELERLRTRIATDLHDDIGANLTRIAILSEVARAAPVARDPERGASLSSIATIARESVTSLGDIVWAIRPDRDTVQDVVRKMRHHAEEVFEGRGIDLVFDAPDGSQSTRLAVDIRRDLYLFFKEAVNNAARHSRCTRVSISMHVVGTRLLLEVADDGVGFDPTVASDGAGLASMRSRAGRLGASLEFRSGPGSGTTVWLSMPLGKPRGASHLPAQVG